MHPVKVDVFTFTRKKYIFMTKEKFAIKLKTKKYNSTSKIIQNKLSTNVKERIIII